ncbi:MAG TPA: UDP binding domain-containing protein [Candidatus Limnocylindria bacterium]|nr:UDP binding domain-containing protein [Candidatus Limnocylindria bacterium]
MKDLARGRKARRVGDVEVIPLDDLEILSFDLEQERACIRSASHLFRRWYPQLVTLRTQEGRTLTATDGHPMIVQNGHGLDVRRADQVDPESRLVLAVDLPPGSCPERIDLVAAISPDPESVRVVPRSGRWDEHWDDIRRAARGSGVERKDVAKHNSLPLSAYLTLEHDGRAPFRRDQLLLATGPGPSHTTVPFVIRVNEDFARLIGYYLSKGCLNRDCSWRTRWTFGAHEDELIADLCGILDRIGLRWTLHRVKRWKAVQIKISSNLFGRLLGEYLGCGRRSEEMRMPPFFLGASREIRRALLGALVNGDGGVHVTTGPRTYRKNGREWSHRCNTACVSYFTSSPALLQQVTLLMHSLGLVPSVKGGKPELRLFSDAAVRQIAPLLLGRKGEKLATYLANRAKSMPVRRVRRHDHYASVEARAVERRGGGWVYSIEVPGTQTYVTSYGLVSHNCIPIDPFYLSWKARASGFEARFIELAGHVNGHMPEHVVDLVAQNLNRRGKAVRGSRVLVLGVSYKADIDDTRESPSLDIMQTLHDRGALIDYSDPYVPSMNFLGRRLKSVTLSPARIRRYDCVVIATAHKEFRYAEILRSAKGVVDTRNALRGKRSNKLIRL